MPKKNQKCFLRPKNPKSEPLENKNVQVLGVFTLKRDNLCFCRTYSSWSCEIKQWSLLWLFSAPIFKSKKGAFSEYFQHFLLIRSSAPKIGAADNTGLHWTLFSPNILWQVYIRQAPKLLGGGGIWRILGMLVSRTKYETYPPNLEHFGPKQCILTRNTVTKYSILAGEEFGVTVRWLGKNTRSAYLLYICGSRAIRAMVLAASSLCWLTSIFCLHFEWIRQ